MGTEVLLGLALLVFGGAAMRVHVRRTSWHTVQAQHRALATIGKLAAEHSKDEGHDAERSSKSAVRVVRGDGSASLPAAPPVLRSRPRRSPATATTETTARETKEPEPEAPVRSLTPRESRRTGEVLPGPSVKLVREQILEPLPTELSRPAPAVPRAVLPIIPPMRPLGSSAETLRFDALSDPAPRKDDQKSAAIKPRSPARARAQIGTTVNRGNAAAARTVRAGTAAFADFQAWGRRVVSSVVATARAVLAWLSRQPRAATGAAAGLLVLVAIAGLAATAGGSGAGRHPAAAARPPAGHQASASPPAGLPSVQQGAVAQQGAQVPASLLEMTSSTSAVYQVVGPISVVLDASGPCWIEARRARPNGGLLFEGTLVPGQTWTVAGPTWLRLGNPTAVSLTVNGQLVSPPAAQGTPFDLQIG